MCEYQALATGNKEWKMTRNESVQKILVRGEFYLVIAQCTKSLRKKISSVILFIWTIKSGEKFWSLHFAIPWIGSSITLRDVITEEFITAHWCARALEHSEKQESLFISHNVTYTIKKGKSDFMMTIAICVFFCDVTETGRVASLSAPTKSKVTVEIKDKLKWPLLTRFSKVCLNFHYFISWNYLYSQNPSGEDNDSDYLSFTNGN